MSEIGFGGWGIGGRTVGLTSYGETDDSTSILALEHAFEQGITFFDSSNVYGDGRSERLIGETFKGRRDQIVLATKAGFQSFDRPADFSPESLRQSLHGSLTRLQTDYLDLLQLHGPSMDELRGSPEIIRTLDDLIREGLIREYGVSLKSPEDGIAAISELGFAAAQVNLNMLDTRAVDCGLLEYAAERGGGVIARTPLAFGMLTGTVSATSTFVEGDHRSRWPAEQLKSWIDGAEHLFGSIRVPGGQTRTQVALRYCLSFPGVSTVIPGILTPAEAAENAAASDLGPLSEPELSVVEEINRQRAKLKVAPNRSHRLPSDT